MIFALGFLVQLLCCLIFSSEPYADQLEYINWHPRRAPLLPVLLSVFPWYLINAVAHGWTCAIISRISKGYVGVVYALYPWALYAGCFVLTESLTTCLLCLGVYLLRNSRDGFAGFIFGLSSLARPTLALLGLFTGRWRVALASLVLVLPWSIYKSYEYRAPVLIAPSGVGNNVYIGSFEFRDDQPAGEVWSDGQVAMDKERLDLGLSRIIEDPISHISASLCRIPMLWISTRAPISSFCFFLLFIVSLGADQKKWILLVPIYLTAVHLNLHYEARYTVPARPFMIMSICAWFEQLVRSLRWPGGLRLGPCLWNKDLTLR